MKQRIVVGAHYGLKDWLAQRVTAVILLIYTLILLGTVLLTSELSYGVWAELFSQATTMTLLLRYTSWCLKSSTWFVGT